MKFLFKLLRKFNDGIPTRMEVRRSLKFIYHHVGIIYTSGLSDRILNMMNDYIAGDDLSKVGKSHGVTRERVRQCLIKGCRVSYDIIEGKRRHY